MPRVSKAPCVVLLPGAFKAVTRWSAGSTDEQWGFLIGRLAEPGVYRISRATIEPAVERTPNGIKVDWSRAFASELRLRKGSRDIPVGKWHSHPHGDRGYDAMAIQISRTDKLNAVEGAVEMICATCSKSVTMPREHLDFLLARKVGKTVCRVEAWLRCKRRFLPCELGVA